MAPATVNETEVDAQGARARSRKALRLSAWFGAVMVVAAPAFAGVGYVRFEWPGVIAALVAGLVCWAGGTAALWLAALAKGPNGAVGGLLGGMFLRAGLPFVFGLIAQQRSEVLAAGGIFGMVLAYYLVALLSETLLSLKLVESHPAKDVAKAV